MATFELLFLLIDSCEFLVRTQMTMRAARRASRRPRDACGQQRPKIVRLMTSSKVVSLLRMENSGAESERKTLTQTSDGRAVAQGCRREEITASRYLTIESREWTLQYNSL